MSADSQVNFTVLRSVIDNYRQRKEHIEKREGEVKGKLARMRAQTPRKEESIETRNSSSQMIPPSDSCPQNQGGLYGQESGELLFHSKYCAYKDSDKSINELNSSELISKYAAMPKKKHTGKTKFSFKNYDKRNDLDTDSEDAEKANVVQRKPPKRRVTKEHGEQRETRGSGRKYDNNHKRIKEPLERGRVDDRSNGLIAETKSDRQRHKEAKGTDNRTMDRVAERLERMAMMKQLGRTTPEQYFENNTLQVSRYEEDERRDSVKFAKQGKSSRKTSSRVPDELSKYPILMDLMKDNPSGKAANLVSKHRKSNTPNKPHLSTKDSLNDFEANRDHKVTTRRAIKARSSTSDSGSLSQYETSEKNISLRRSDSCPTSDEEHSRPYRSSERPSRPHSPAARLNKCALPSSPVGRTGDRGGRDERARGRASPTLRPHVHDEVATRGSFRSSEQTSHPRESPESGSVGGAPYGRGRDTRGARPPVHDEVATRSSYQSPEQKPRAHSPAERINTSRSMGVDAPTTHTLQGRSRDTPPTRPPVHDEAATRNSYRSCEQKPRPHSPAERLDVSESVRGGAAPPNSREGYNEIPYNRRGCPPSRPVRDEVAARSSEAKPERLVKGRDERSREQRPPTPRLTVHDEVATRGSYKSPDQKPPEKINTSGYTGVETPTTHPREGRDERSRGRGSPTPTPPVHDEYRSPDQLSRASPDRLIESGSVGGGHSPREGHERPRDRGGPTSRPPVHDEVSTHSSYRSSGQRSRASPDRLIESGSVGGGHERERPNSRGPPVHDEVATRGLSRSSEQSSRPHTSPDGLSERGSVGAAPYYDERVESPPRRPLIHDEVATRSSYRVPEQLSRPRTSPGRSTNSISIASGSITSYNRDGNKEQNQSSSRTQNPLPLKPSVGGTSNNSNKFDETYSNNFLIYMIQNSLPRAMSSILISANGCNNKPSQVVLNSVQEVVTIKKLICDELDRRETIGRPFKIRRRDKEDLMRNFIYAKKIHDRLDRGFSVREALSIIRTKTSASSMRLQDRTIQAIRQANQILGGNVQDPADADDLEKAAVECLRKLGRLHVETVSNDPYLASSSKEARPLVKLPMKEDTCKSCRQDWFAEEVTRLKNAILNMEQHMKFQAVPAPVINRQKQLSSHQNYENNRDSSANRKHTQQRQHFEDTIKSSVAHAMSANHSHPSQKTGNNAFTAFKNNQSHRQH